VASVYIQTGEADTPRQLEKERFMATLAHRVAAMKASGRDAVVCGDWNIAHTENDIKNWKGNVNKSGFLPSERQWLTDLLAASMPATLAPRTTACSPVFAMWRSSRAGQ
jgi:exodeoxyribonuclease III